MKKNKKRKNDNKQIKKNIKKDENKFSFDDEIIIGVTKIDKNEKKSKKSKASKNNKKLKNNKKTQNNKKKNNKKVKEDYEKKNHLYDELEELDEEELIKRRIKRIKIIKYTSLVILILVAITAILFSPLFNIKVIKVTGNSKLSENEIISLSEIKTDENTFIVNKINSIRNIKQNPYIQSVTIKRNLPSEIEIIVEEREVNFMLEFGENYIYINSQGYILEISSEKLNYPIIQGQATEDKDLVVGNRLVKEDLIKMSTILKIMEQAQINEIDTLISKIDISDSENYKLVLEKEKKTVYLGDCSNLNTRMLNVKVILEKEKGIEGEIFVDMDLNNSYPVFRQKV